MFELEQLKDSERVLTYLLQNIERRSWREAPAGWGNICLEDFRRQDDAFRQQCNETQKRLSKSVSD